MRRRKRWYEISGLDYESLSEINMKSKQVKSENVLVENHCVYAKMNKWQFWWLKFLMFIQHNGMKIRTVHYHDI